MEGTQTFVKKNAVILICHMFWAKMPTFHRQGEPFFCLVFKSFHVLKCDIGNTFPCELLPNYFQDLDFECSPIWQFYQGKTVFITGATGFMGKVGG